MYRCALSRKKAWCSVSQLTKIYNLFFSVSVIGLQGCFFLEFFVTLGKKDDRSEMLRGSLDLILFWDTFTFQSTKVILSKLDRFY